MSNRPFQHFNSCGNVTEEVIDSSGVDVLRRHRRGPRYRANEEGNRRLQLTEKQPPKEGCVIWCKCQCSESDERQLRDHVLDAKEHVPLFGFDPRGLFSMGTKRPTGTVKTAQNGFQDLKITSRHPWI